MIPDLNQPVENPKLKALLNKRATAPQEAQLDVMNEIAEEIAMNAHFLAVVNFGGSPVQNNSDGTALFPEGATMSFPGLSLKDGSSCLPFFTDWDELRKWEPFKDGNVNTLVMTFDDIHGMVSNDNGTVIINPFGDAFMMPFGMIDQIKHVKDVRLGKVQQQVIKKDTKVTIGDPKDYPKQMTDAISAYAKKIKGIKAIWLKLMVKEGEQSFLLTVEAEGDARSYFQGIADSALPHLPRGMYLDMIPSTDRLAETSTEGEPFYRRKKGLFG